MKRLDGLYNFYVIPLVLTSQLPLPLHHHSALMVGSLAKTRLSASCIRPHPSTGTPLQHCQQASTSGAHLASLSSSEDLGFTQALCASAKGCWVGGRALNSSAWQWADGRSLWNPSVFPGLQHNPTPEFCMLLTKDGIISVVAEICTAGHEGLCMLDSGASHLPSPQCFKLGDKIERLPGQPGQGSHPGQYGGYITVDPKARRALFYYFVEANADASSKPLILWLNGGPGCSSLIGAMEEIGPFCVHNDDKTLYPNSYSWNMVANLLFLENAPGVGFSYTKNTSELNTAGDARTARDSFTFLESWIDRFPEYKHRELYIVKESYVGHFVPELAELILHCNSIAGSKYRDHSALINLQGIAIGNGLIKLIDMILVQSVTENLFVHGLLSPDVIKIARRCHYGFGNTADVDNPECQKLSEARGKFDEDHIDMYNIYATLCLDKKVTSTPRVASLENFDPCSEYYMTAYLNRPEVQQALHANTTDKKMNYPWSQCSSIRYFWQDKSKTILQLIKNFSNEGRIRVWLYSGDLDGVVPISTTMMYLEELNLTVRTPWSLWYAADSPQIAGYTLEYGGTVRGAGHKVPSYKPWESLELVKTFLKGEKLNLVPKKIP